jgi:uncharacterized membrane protein
MIATFIILALLCIKLGLSLASHNKEIRIKHHWFSSIIAFIIMLVLYYYAGLLDKFM